MKKQILLFAVGLILGFSPMAFAGFTGNELTTLKGNMAVRGTGKGHANDVGDTSKSTWAELFSGPDTSGDIANFLNSDEIGFWLNPNVGRSALFQVL